MVNTVVCIATILFLSKTEFVNCTNVFVKIRGRVEGRCSSLSSDEQNSTKLYQKNSRKRDQFSTHGKHPKVSTTIFTPYQINSNQKYII